MHDIHPPFYATDARKYMNTYLQNDDEEIAAQAWSNNVSSEENVLTMYTIRQKNKKKTMAESPFWIVWDLVIDEIKRLAANDNLNGTNELRLACGAIS